MNLLKSRIIQGTLLLTVAGFITRILGFFYRIFLADKLGAAVLGSYQLIFPIFAICSSIYGAGVQTAISQLIAAEQGKRSKLCSSDSPTAKGLTTFQNTIEQKLYYCLGVSSPFCLPAASLFGYTQKQIGSLHVSLWHRSVHLICRLCACCFPFVALVPVLMDITTAYKTPPFHL